MQLTLLVVNLSQKYQMLDYVTVCWQSNISGWIHYRPDTTSHQSRLQKLTLGLRYGEFNKCIKTMDYYWILRKIDDGTNNEESLIFHKNKISYSISRQISSLVAFFPRFSNPHLRFTKELSTFDEKSEC